MCTQPPVLWELGVQWLGHEAGHSHPSSTEDADQWSCTLLHTFLNGVYRDSFVFMLLYCFFLLCSALGLCSVEYCKYRTPYLLEYKVIQHVRWSPIHSLHFSGSYLPKTYLTLCMILTWLPPVCGWWKGKWFLLYIYITTGHHWCTGPGMLNLLKFWYSPLWGPSGSQVSQ